MSGFVPVLVPTGRSTSQTHRTLPTSHGPYLLGLSYVLFLYQDVPLLVVFIHLRFMSRSLVFDLDLGYISLSFRLQFSLDI